MMLTFHNTLTNKKDRFNSIDDKIVKIYSCGPTVYSKPHIGNMRAYAFSDLLVRLFLTIGYDVNHVINITDVGHLVSDADDGDDKLEREAKKQRKSAYDIANENTDLFYKYLNDLNIKKPSVFPKATDHIQEQINMILELERKGMVYKIDDGLYFNTFKFDTYTELGNINVEGLREGARVDKGQKKNATDFALWKFSPKNAKREMEWDSPWGIGFPGWHIECSAMALKHLGETIDIHTGGIDHIHIHHSNEIAQSESVNGCKMSNFWMHVNFLKLVSENKNDVLKNGKMAKSNGTAYTVDDLIEKGYKGLDLKYYYLTSHYRSELKFSFKILDSTTKAFKRLKNKSLSVIKNNLNVDIDVLSFDIDMINIMTNDLDTPNVLAYFHDIINGNQNDLKKLSSIITFESLFKLDIMEEEQVDKIPKHITMLVNERIDAKNNKMFEKADELRREVNELGYLIEDNGKDYIVYKK